MAEEQNTAFEDRGVGDHPFHAHVRTTGGKFGGIVVRPNRHHRADRLAFEGPHGCLRERDVVLHLRTDRHQHPRVARFVQIGGHLDRRLPNAERPDVVMARGETVE